MRSAERLFVLLIVVLAALCGLALVRGGLTIGLHVPLNFNEGWNAYHAADFAAGRPLYPDPSRQFFNNYPPLSFVIVAPLGRLLGDQMIAGRVVATASFVVWIALIATIARRLGASLLHASVAGVVLAIYMFVFSSFYVGVNDPQILGHALQALGAALLLGDRRSTASLAAAAVLFAAGVFVKNNLVALPLAAALWMLAVDTPRGLRLAVFGAIAALVGAGISVAAFGPQFAAQLLWPRMLLPAKGAQMLGMWILRMALPLAAVGWMAARERRDRQSGFVLTYLAVSIVLGTLFAVGEGVYRNTMFDADAAIALTSALALERLAIPASAARRLALTAMYLGVAALVVVRAATIHWLSPRFWFDPLWSDAQRAGQEIVFVKSRPGPAMCEDLAVCYWAGKPVEVDVFNVRQRMHREPWRIESIANRIDAREFGVVETLERDLGPRFDDALRRNYREDHRNEWGVFWVPR